MLQIQAAPPAPPAPPAPAQLPTTALTAAQPPSPPREEFNDSWIVVPVVMTIVFVLFPLMLRKAWRIWKSTPVARAEPTENARLERIEQAVDAIAIEVERVSEGQRFVTKLLSDDKLRVSS